LKHQGGLLPHIITNYGDSFTPRETHHIGTNFSIYWQSPTKFGQKNAAVLVVVIARKIFEQNEKYSITHQFDAGAAWETLALEASSRGLAIHAMQGLDYERARTDLQIPDNFDVMAMIAIGRRGPKDNHPTQFQEREQPNERKSLTEIVIEGQFKINSSG
jgi:nitroreductase